MKLNAPIRNTDSLLEVGNVPVRTCLLDIANAALTQLNSEHLIPKLMHIQEDTLFVGDCQWDLTRYKRVYVIGAGKAVNHMARALEQILGNRVTAGLVIAKQIEVGDSLHHIEIALGGHPYPNANGQAATRRVLDMLADCEPGDLVIGAFSGGSSALMNCPVAGATVEEEKQLTKSLLTSGAKILEINTIRRHISEVDGGRLAKRISDSGATLINLVLSDRVGDAAVGTPRQPVGYTGTQIGLDPTTFKDAIDVLERYDLLESAPTSLLAHLRNSAPEDETPSEPLPNVSTFVIQGLEDACDVALEAARDMGIPAYVLTSELEGDSFQAGNFLGALASEIRVHQRPFASPCFLIVAGETTVTLDGPAGKGGPSQELATAFAHRVSGLDNIGIAAIETEGTDGPTDLAGALADNTTNARAEAEGFCLLTALKNHDCYPVHTALSDHLVTGNTGTNLCDLNIIYIG